jgi:hypothetical protein
MAPFLAYQLRPGFKWLVGWLAGWLRCAAARHSAAWAPRAPAGPLGCSRRASCPAAWQPGGRPDHGQAQAAGACGGQAGLGGAAVHRAAARPPGLSSPSAQPGRLLALAGQAMQALPSPRHPRPIFRCLWTLTWLCSGTGWPACWPSWTTASRCGSPAPSAARGGAATSAPAPCAGEVRAQARCALQVVGRAKACSCPGPACRSGAPPPWCAAPPPPCPCSRRGQRSRARQRLQRWAGLGLRPAISCAPRTAPCISAPPAPAGCWRCLLLPLPRTEAAGSRQGCGPGPTSKGAAALLRCCRRPHAGDHLQGSGGAAPLAGVPGPIVAGAVRWASSRRSCTLQRLLLLQRLHCVGGCVKQCGGPARWCQSAPLLSSCAARVRRLQAAPGQCTALASLSATSASTAWRWGAAQLAGAGKPNQSHAPPLLGVGDVLASPHHKPQHSTAQNTPCARRSTRHA